MLRAVGASVIGPGHLQEQQPSQDALSLRGWRSGWIAAVADGLGSKSQSALGARLAVQSAQAVLRSPDSWELPDRDLVTLIYRRWLKAIGTLEPGTHATTLLVAASDSTGHVRVFQLGDGVILARTLKGIEVITPDRSGFGNQTKALGVDRSWSAWVTATVKLKQPGDLVLLMTDGVADDIETGSTEGFVDAVHRQVVKRSRRAGRKWLKNELTQWATPGHTDDKTVAMIFKG